MEAVLRGRQVAHLGQWGRGMVEAVMERLQMRKQEQAAGLLRTPAAEAGNYTPRERCYTLEVCPEEEVCYPYLTE